MSDADGDAWRVVESAVEYETGWYAGGYDLVEQPDGSRKRYYWAALPPAVVVVAVHDGDVVVVEQYRPAIREHCVELPAGIVEGAFDPATGPAGPCDDDWTGESYAAAGARELREETGFVADPDDVTLVEAFWCSTGVLRHRRGVVFAGDVRPTGDRDLDDGEFLAVDRIPVEDALDVARAHHANDATLDALLLADADGHVDL